MCNVSRRLSARHISTTTPLRVGQVRIPTDVGSPGDVLTSNGLGSDCSFQAPPEATQSIAGLLSAEDKTRLDHLWGLSDLGNSPANSDEGTPSNGSV